jgi:hypothetical protein
VTTPLLSTRRAADHLGRGYEWFRTLIKQGRGPTPSIQGNRGASHFFAVEELDRWGALCKRNECIPPVAPKGRSRVVIENTIVELDGILAASTDLAERDRLYTMARALRWAIGEVETLTLVHGATGPK